MRLRKPLLMGNSLLLTTNCLPAGSESQSGRVPAAHQLLDTSVDCVKSVGVDGALLGMNPDGMCLMEIDDFTTVAGKSWWDLWPERHQATVQAAVQHAVNGGVARFSAECPTAKGASKHWDVLVSPIHSEEGKVVRLLSISRDVTREVQLAGERALVTSELAHRIKNLFAMVDGIIGLTSRSATDTTSFAQSLRSRIGGLARSIEYIYGKDRSPLQNKSHSVHGLLHELMRPYEQTPGVDVVISGDDLGVADDAVTSLALVINELATNAVKYGALANAGGTVSIATATAGDAFIMEWTEAGGEPTSEPLSRGFGSTLVDRIVKLQLQGDIARDWTRQGLHVRITFPARRLA